MTNPITSIISGLPAAVGVTMGTFLLAMLAGWIGSAIAGFRSEKGLGLRGLLVFPVTNPIALSIFLFRDPKAAALPAACYLLASR